MRGLNEITELSLKKQLEKCNKTIGPQDSLGHEVCKFLQTGISIKHTILFTELSIFPPGVRKRAIGATRKIPIMAEIDT